jgi:hypothetical protein
MGLTMHETLLMERYGNISHAEAMEWLTANDLFDNHLHRSFRFWIRHTILCKNSFPQLTKFYTAEPRWLAAYNSADEIVAIHYYSIVDREMFDGYLIRRPDQRGTGVGGRLGIQLKEHTKGLWDVNWSTCEDKYVELNKYMGYSVIGSPHVDERLGVKVFLLKREPE